MRGAAQQRMAGVRSHEDLIVWQLAYQLKVRVYALVKSGPIARDATLADQLRSAAGSAPRLIAEGFGRACQEFRV